MVIHICSNIKTETKKVFLRFEVSNHLKLFICAIDGVSSGDIASSRKKWQIHPLHFNKGYYALMLIILCYLQQQET